MIKRLVNTPRRSIFKSARVRLFIRFLVVFGSLQVLVIGLAYWEFNSRIYSGVDSDLSRQQGRVLKGLQDPNYCCNPFIYFSNVWSTFPAGWRIIVANPEGLVNETSDCPDPPEMLYYCPGPMEPLSDAAIQQVIRRSKEVIGPWAANQPYLSAVSDIRTVTDNHQPWRVLTFDILAENRQPVGIFQIARLVSGEESALHQLRVLLLFGGGIGLLLAAVASVFLADRVLIPIRQALARQRQFTADASHELRTPLALIRANAEMLYRHANSSDAELVGEIIGETEQLNRLVGDLLTLARADVESLKLDNRPVDFRSLVSSVHEDLQTIAESRGIETSVTLNGPVMVQGDEGRLRQLLLILLDNALKYTDPGGRVDVTVGREDNRARLVVSDTGIGIPSNDLPHIFERFYRVDRAREHESGGTGLGLAIARWIVQAHHGSIKVESEQGKGSRFRVDLPVG
jgi:signal transduction histidine kinase